MYNSSTSFPPLLEAEELEGLAVGGQTLVLVCYLSRFSAE